jgi:hypothetical protein
VSRHVVIHFRKVLHRTRKVNGLFLLHTVGWFALTETKKLLVPSARSKKSGNSFNHVSSPYMTSLPLPLSKSLALICASHVSCVPSVEDVSDSAKFRITSTKEGMEPVVMALTRGMVMVGEVACAVNGRAVPSRIKLDSGQPGEFHLIQAEIVSGVPLHKAHATIFAEHEVAPQRIHNHEDQLIEWRRRWLAPSLTEHIAFTIICVCRQSWHKRLVRKEASREDENRDRDQ